MSAKQVPTNHSYYEWLIIVALSAFAVSGSLGLVVCLLFLSVSLLLDWRLYFSKMPKREAVALYLALSLIFYWLILRSIPITAPVALLQTSSPMIPIPIIGALILFSAQTGFKLSPRHLSNAACAAIVFLYFVYFTADFVIHPKWLTGINAERIYLFSGNPIPFGTIVGTISLMAIIDWRHRTTTARIVQILLALLGAYAAAILAGARGVTLGFIIASPAIIYHLFRSKVAVLSYVLLVILLTIFLAYLHVNQIIESSPIQRLVSGLETIITGKNTDNSNYMRLQMWIAAWTAFLDQPLVGYGISERFLAIKPFIKIEAEQFSHAHNDILSNAVAGGSLALVLSAISFSSGLIYCFVITPGTAEQNYLAVVTAILFSVVALSNTINFNDASSAFFAFTIALLYFLRARSKDQEGPL